MDSSTCVICSKSFPYRKGKKYCSNSCKQQGYNNAKAGGTIPGINDKLSAIKTFYLDDYNKYCSTFGSYDQNEFIHYCFITRNFDEDESIGFINELVDNILTGSFLSNLKKESHPLGRLFLQFENEFHQGKFLIKDKRKTTIEAPIIELD